MIGHTIKAPTKYDKEVSILDLIEKGVPHLDEDWETHRNHALSRTWQCPIYSTNWTMPAGAYSRESCGSV